MAPAWLQHIAHSVHEHPYADIYDIPKCYEVKFPIASVLRHEIVSEYGSDVSGFVGATSIDTKSILHDHMETIVDLQIRNAFARVADAYEPTGLIFTDTSWYIACASPETEHRESSHLLFHPISFDLANDVCWQDFLRCCGGVREDLPGDGGFFPVASDNRAHDAADQLNGDKKWRNSRTIFCASNGEQIIRNQKGDMGWFLIGKGVIADCEFRLSDLAIAFANHITNLGWNHQQTKKMIRMPFDSFSSGLRDQLQFGDAD